MEELLFQKKINSEKIRLQKKHLELLKRNYAILINQEIAERIDSMNLEKIQKYEYEQADKG